jgi:hypothetical protein
MTMSSDDEPWQKYLSDALDKELVKQGKIKRPVAKDPFRFGIAVLLIAIITALTGVLSKPDVYLAAVLVLAVLTMMIYGAYKIHKSLPNRPN